MKEVKRYTKLVLKLLNVIFLSDSAKHAAEAESQAVQAEEDLRESLREKEELIRLLQERNTALEDTCNSESVATPASTPASKQWCHGTNAS